MTDKALILPKNDWPYRVDALPATLSRPHGYRLLHDGHDGRQWLSLDGRVSVIESVSRERDGRVWHHVSMARRTRMPEWEELTALKRAFVGDREAYVVLPPEKRYVNIHPNCLHLWACLDVEDGAVLPDFTHGGKTI